MVTLSRFKTTKPVMRKAVPNYALPNGKLIKFAALQSEYKTYRINRSYYIIINLDSVY